MVVRTDYITGRGRPLKALGRQKLHTRASQGQDDAPTKAFGHFDLGVHSMDAWMERQWNGMVSEVRVAIQPQLPPPAPFGRLQKLSVQMEIPGSSQGGPHAETTSLGTSKLTLQEPQTRIKATRHPPADRYRCTQ